MIKTNTEQTILPLDLNSMMNLLNDHHCEFNLLAVAIDRSSPLCVKINVNIQHFDPDSIKINICTDALVIEAIASVQFLNNQSDPGSLRLTRQCDKKIDLAPGLDLKNIRSNIDDDTLVIHIPFA